MPYLLHIESATENCSIALSKGDKLLKVLSENNTQRHSEIITIMIQEVLNSAGIGYKNLDAVSLSEGPGSYTSLRVGTSAAKAICYAMNIPLISVKTLTSLALNIYQKEYLNCYYFPMIDARRMEVYGSLYDKDMCPIFEDIPIILNEFDLNKYIKNDSNVFLTGNGAIKAMSVFQDQNIVNTNQNCKAENLIFPAFFKWKNNDFSDVAYFSPNYIKPPNITLPKSKYL